MGASNRVVLFLDLDHFFAQVEEIQQPALKGRPVVVCVYSGRTETSGVVSSANYEARSYGVRAGMPIARALRLLPPTAVFLPARLQLYSSYSERVMAILSQYSDKLSVESVDEAAVDITDRVGGDFSKAEELARELKERIRSEMGLRCSVGVAPNRIVAKVAADSSKPDGLKVFRPEEVRSFLAGLDVEVLPGVGKKLGRILKGLGVETVGKLAEMEPTLLIPIVGRRRTIQMIMAARGESDQPIKPRGPRKQVSRIVTLKKNTRDVDEVMERIIPLINELKSKIEGGDMRAETVGLIVVSTELKLLTRQKTLPTGISDKEVVEIVRRMLRQLLEEMPELIIRRVGVKFSGLRTQTGQESLTSFL